MTDARHMRGSPPLLLRALGVWAMIVAIESVHGTFRRLAMEPRLGDLPARQVSVFTGSILVLTIGWTFRRWLAVADVRQALSVGLLWVGLTLAFEVGLGLALGLDAARIWSDYDLRQGGLMSLGLLVLGLTPLLTRSRAATANR